MNIFIPKNYVLFVLIAHIIITNIETIKKEFSELEAYVKSYLEPNRMGLFALFCITLLCIGSPFIYKIAKKKKRQISGYYEFKQEKKEFIKKLKKEPETTILNNTPKTLKKYLNFDERYSLILKEFFFHKKNREYNSLLYNYNTHLHHYINMEEIKNESQKKELDSTLGLQEFYTANSAEAIAEHILTQDETTILKKIAYWSNFREQMHALEKVKHYEDNLRLGWVSTAITVGLSFTFVHYWADDLLDLINTKKEVLYSVFACVPLAFFNVLNGARIITMFYKKKVDQEENDKNNKEHEKADPKKQG